MEGNSQEETNEWLEKEIYPIAEKICGPLNEAVRTKDAQKITAFLTAHTEVMTIAAAAINARRDNRTPEHFARVMAMLESCLECRFPEGLSPDPQAAAPPVTPKPPPQSWG